METGKNVCFICIGGRLFARASSDKFSFWNFFLRESKKLTYEDPFWHSRFTGQYNFQNGFIRLIHQQWSRIHSFKINFETDFIQKKIRSTYSVSSFPTFLKTKFTIFRLLAFLIKILLLCAFTTLLHYFGISLYYLLLFFFFFSQKVIRNIQFNKYYIPTNSTIYLQIIRSHYSIDFWNGIRV